MPKSNITKVDYLKSAVMFSPIICYSPFFFDYWVYPPLRIGTFFLLSIYLFFSNKRYSKNDVQVFCALMMLAMLMVLRNSSGSLGLISIGNYCLTIFFGWSLYRYLATNRRRQEILLASYLGFFLFICICSILSVIYLVLFGEFDLFGFKSDIYSHLVTPFGVLFVKDFGSINVYRSFFYFHEPVFVAIFYAANIIIVAPLLKDNVRFFVRTNLLGGFVSMSMTFYVVLFALYITKKISSFFSFIATLIVTFCFSYFIQIVDILAYSSSDDRMNRFYLFTLAMDAANAAQLWFGHGILFDTGFDRAFNSGFTLSIYETGLLGTALQIFLLFRLSPNSLTFIFYIFAAAVVDPLRMPLFWFIVITASLKFEDEAAREKISYHT